MVSFFKVHQLLNNHYNIRYEFGILYSPLIFGCAAFLTGLCALMLPETLNVRMPETLEDGERSPLVLPCRQLAAAREELPLEGGELMVINNHESGLKLS